MSNKSNQLKQRLRIAEAHCKRLKDRQAMRLNLIFGGGVVLGFKIKMPDGSWHSFRGSIDEINPETMYLQAQAVQA